MQNHIQHLLCLLLVNFLLLVGNVSARTICIAEVATNNLNVRAAPAIDAEVVTQLNRGQQIVATILDEEWAMTYADNNVPVYFSAEFINVVSEIVTTGPDLLTLIAE
tara:strand:- start:92 stop:412 length:321 start_codon:yes stop_codon:yes gene_type:complete